jgi:hypothetical protein
MLLFSREYRNFAFLYFSPLVSSSSKYFLRFNGMGFEYQLAFKNSRTFSEINPKRIMIKKMMVKL